MIAALAAASIPIATPIQILNGAQHIVFNGHFFSVSPKIRGRILHAPEFTATALSSTAQHLATLHQVMPHLNLITTADSIVPIEVIEHKVKLLEDLMKEKSKGALIDNTVKRLSHIKRRMLNDLMPYSDDFKQPLLTATILVHGDFHNQNILFNARDRLVGMLDFEEAHYGHPLEDIMHFIQLACCNTGYHQANITKSGFF